MRKLLVFSLLLSFVGFCGCDENDDENTNTGDKTYSGIENHCDGYVKWFIESDYVTSFSDAQKSQLKDALLTDCKKYIENIPVCVSELDKAYLCLKDSQNDSACSNDTTEFRNCQEKNSTAYDSYRASTNQFPTAKPLIISFGMEESVVDNLMKEFDWLDN